MNYSIYEYSLTVLLSLYVNPASANRKDTDPLIISNVKKGSVAHR